MKRITLLALMMAAAFCTESYGQAVATQKTAQGEQAKAAAIAVALKDGTATLTPENTKVNFVGIHVGDEPKPRLGGFAKFTGSLAVNEDGTLKSLSMEFDTASLWTQNGADLTAHLKNADFLNVEKYPSAKFVSKSIKASEKEGMIEVVGDFTLMGSTNEISMPSKLTKTDEGVMLKSEFKLDRGVFGMNKMMDRVSKEVAITLSVGEKTSGGAAGGKPAEGRGNRRGGRNPGAMFKNQDKDGDGKLTGDEIPQFLKAKLDTLDGDKDGSITLEELKKGMGGRGGRGRSGQ